MFKRIYYFIRKDNKIRNILKGYDLLNKSDRLNLINQIKTEFSKTPINNKDIHTVLNEPSDICLHQFLFYRLVNQDFNQEILSYFGSKTKKLTYPLPQIWIKILKNNDIEVNEFRSSLLWFFFQLKWYSIGIVTTLIELNTLFFRTSYLDKPYVYFDNLTKGNFPTNENNENNILGWFIKQTEGKDFKYICHDNKNINYQYKSHQFSFINKYYIEGFFLKVKTLIALISRIIISFFTLKERLLLRERVFEILVGNMDKNNLAKIYFFHNSHLHFKKLWTYEVEKKGSKTVFIQYSSNFLPFKEKNKEYKLDFKWNYLSWNEYWLWSETQKSIFNTHLIKKALILNKGPIPFSSKEYKKRKDFSTYKILVFPVDPFRTLFHYKLGFNVEYYTDENFINFILIILEISKKHQFEILLKQKRYNPFWSKKYKKFINTISNHKNIQLLDHDLSAFDLIEKTNPLAVLSMPYTSTALIAKYKNIPSVYFDITNKLDPLHYANNGISVIQDKVDLENFLLELK